MQFCDPHQFALVIYTNNFLCFLDEREINFNFITDILIISSLKTIVMHFHCFLVRKYDNFT